MQRASSSRRRLNSTDSNRSAGTTGSIRKPRSRSQERSVNSDYHAEEEAYYSQQESTSEEDEGVVEDDVFEDALEQPEEDNGVQVIANGYLSEKPCVKIVGVVNHKDRVVITSSGEASTSGTTASSMTSHSLSAPTSPRIYKRSASDPFDLSAVEEDSSCETSTELAMTGSASPHMLPTLPRYPVAETRDTNCWSEPSVEVFRVRGKDYLSSKKKVPSDPYLLRARGLDLLLFPKENSKREPVSLMERTSSVLNGTLHKEPTLVLNFRFPWGLMVLYFEIPDHLAKYLNYVPQDQMYDETNETKKEQSTKNNTTTSNGNTSTTTAKPNLDHLTPGDRTLARWIMGSTEYKNQRLKLIPIVVEGPWVVRNLVTGKPAIIGTKLPVTYHCRTTAADNSNSNLHNHNNALLCAELDIGNSSNTAKKIVSLCRRYMNALTVDIGFVIQGNTTEELPEQMLGSIRIHGVDPLKAPTFV